ncbi:MAG: type IV secretion system protein VirB3 [Gammaproteobacteria bacterium]
MSQENDLKISPLFYGLTRPPMLLGITVDYLFVCFLLSYGLFMLTANPIYLVSYIPLHIFGWIACKIDPNIFRVIMKRISCGTVRNKMIWGCQSYEPF